MNMNVKALSNRSLHVIKLSTFAFALVAAALVGWRWLRIADTDLTTPVAAQTDVMLERRISQVEQRFYYIESRLNNLESQARYPTVLPGANSANQTELGQLRNEVDTLRGQLDSLRSRVGELECGVIKLDERTLSPAGRSALQRSAQGSSEPCRTDSQTPIRLSARP
jgi:hypothetical protein